MNVNVYDMKIKSEFSWYLEEKERKMNCSDFLIQRLGLHLREEATSYRYVSVLHLNRTLLQRDVLLQGDVF